MARTKAGRPGRLTVPSSVMIAEFSYPVGDVASRRLMISEAFAWSAMSDGANCNSLMVSFVSSDRSAFLPYVTPRSVNIVLQTDSTRAPSPCRWRDRDARWWHPPLLRLNGWRFIPLAALARYVFRFSLSALGDALCLHYLF
jgi:hypothetical protein